MALTQPGVVDADLPFPRFSVAERDRRWKLVRELMAREGLSFADLMHRSGLDHVNSDRSLTGGTEPSMFRPRKMTTMPAPLMLKPLRPNVAIALPFAPVQSIVTDVVMVNPLPPKSPESRQ